MVCDLLVVKQKNFSESLNPCFNGIWSATRNFKDNTLQESVLILVLMEYGLRQSAEML